MATRAEIIAQFLPNGINTAAPDVVEETVSNEGQKGYHPSEIKRGKLLRFQLDGQLWSTVHIYWPTANEGRRALIYHAGHEANWANNWVTVGEAIARGYVVAEIFMLGYHNQPSYPQSLPLTYHYDGGGTETIAGGHNNFATVAANGGRVLPCFLDPVFRTATWLLSHVHGIKSLGIAGHSGGGWTALMAAALDPRFDFAASIHGWCPIGAPGEPTRDYEQIGPWYDSTTYEDFAVMCGDRRNIVITGSLDPVFGAGDLGQSNIDAMTAAIQARGANFDQFTLTAPDHNPTAAEAMKVLDEFDLLNTPAYRCPRYSSSLANATQMASILTQLAGLPRKGDGGTLVPQATWDGAGATPAGWTAAYTVTDLGAGNGRVDCSAQDYDRLYDSAQLSALSSGDQSFAASERGNFAGR